MRVVRYGVPARVELLDIDAAVRCHGCAVRHVWRAGQLTNAGNCFATEAHKVSRDIRLTSELLGYRSPAPNESKQQVAPAESAAAIDSCRTYARDEILGRWVSQDSSERCR